MTPRDVGRFFAKVDRTSPDACWAWLAGKTKDGYGLFGVTLAPGQFRRLYAHRVSYEIHRGPIPVGLDIDHLCRNRACVNPMHMEPVSRRENTLRGLRGPKAECIHGHPLVGANVVTRKNGRHQCRTCEQERQRRRRKTKK